jgi:hypothetical protein
MDIDLLLQALDNRFVHDYEKLHDVIVRGMQDAQNSRASGNFVAILTRFRRVENLTIGELKRVAATDPVRLLVRDVNLSQKA